MNSRIKLILNYKGITATEFAHAIGVQPSNVSHVLNGRNNPSLVFIEKILSFYPEINTRWLILGEGTMLGTEEKKSPMPVDLFSDILSAPDENVEEIEDYKCNIEEEHPKSTSEEIFVKENKPERKIERIITFYSDQSYEEYFPKN